jgi:hypothetical protein
VKVGVIVLRHGVGLAALATLFAGACFAEPPVADTSDDTSGGSCSAGEQGCACYGNGTCENGLECNAEVQLCIPERCVAGDLACVCADGSCVPPYVCAHSLCMPDGGDSESSVGSADTTGASTVSTGSDEIGTVSTSTSTAVGSTSDDNGTEASSDEDPTGVEECAMQSCPLCVSCVDTQACAPEVAACDAVNGCATIVECLVQCGVYLDCLDPCCPGITPTQLEVVNDLMLCKSDECVDSCGGEAELDGCR